MGVIMAVPKLSIQQRKQIAAKRKRNADGTFASRNAGAIAGAVAGAIKGGVTSYAAMAGIMAERGWLDHDSARDSDVRPEWREANKRARELGQAESRNRNKTFTSGGLTDSEKQIAKAAAISGAISGALIGGLAGHIVDKDARRIKSKASATVRGLATIAGENIGRRFGNVYGPIGGSLGGLVGATALGMVHNRLGEKVTKTIDKNAKKSTIANKAWNHIKKYAPGYAAAGIYAYRARKFRMTGGQPITTKAPGGLSRELGDITFKSSKSLATINNFSEIYVPAALHGIKAQFAATHARKIGVNTLKPSSIIPRLAFGHALSPWDVHVATNYAVKAWQSRKSNTKNYSSTKNKTRGKRK